MVEEKGNSERVSIWDYLLLLLRWRKVIIFNILAVGIVIAVITFVVPSWYTASTTILPPTKDTLSLSGMTGLMSGLGALVGGGGGGGFMLPAFSTPSDIFAAILKSKTITKILIDKYDLGKVFKVKLKDDLIKEVQSHTGVQVTQNGLIILTFEAKNAKLAADVANSYIAVLDSINQSINSNQARNNRIFIEERLKQTKNDLRKAEDNLRNFQEKYGAVDLTEQLKAQIQSVAELQGQLTLAEIELGVMQENMSSDNALVRKLKTQIKQIKIQLRNFDQGSPKDTTALILPFSQAPKLGAEFVRLTRELKIQEAVFELLTTQYEQAKIREAKNTPTIQILDYAEPPERRSYPLRGKMVLMGMAGSLVFSVMVLIIIEYFNRLKTEDPQTYEKYYSVVGILYNDVKSLRNYFSRKRSNKPSSKE